MVVLFFGWTINACSAQSLELDFLVAPWPPFISEEGEPPGLIEDYISEVLESSTEFGVRFTKVETWKPVLDRIRTQQNYASLPYLKTDSRTQQFSYSSEPIMIGYNVLFCKKGALPRFLNRIGNDIQNIKGYKIAQIEGYAIWNESKLKKIGYQGAVSCESLDDAFSKLESDEVDFVSENLFVGLHYMQKYAPLRIGKKGERHELPLAFIPFESRFGLPVDRQPMFVLTSRRKQRDILLDKIDDLVAASNRSGVRNAKLLSVPLANLDYLLPENVQVIASGHAPNGIFFPFDSDIQTPVPQGSRGIAIQWELADSRVVVFVISGPLAGEIVKLGIGDVEIKGQIELDFLSK